MKQLKKYWFIFSGGLMLGCSNYQYYAIQKPLATFNQYRTFAWLPVPDTIAHDNLVVDEKVKDEVTTGLEKRGLVLQNWQPDLLVRYSITTTLRIKYYNLPTYVYGSASVNRGVGQNRYGRKFYYTFQNPFYVLVSGDIANVGRPARGLIIDLIERKSHQVVWRGYCTGRLADSCPAIADLSVVVDGVLKKSPFILLRKWHKPIYKSDRKEDVTGAFSNTKIYIDRSKYFLRPA